MDKSFKDFCNDIAYVTDKESVVPCDLIVEEENFHSFITNMKEMSGRFDKLTLSYIQRAFENMGNVSDKIKEKCPDGDIPNNLIDKISQGVYGAHYKDLSDDKCRIINVLSIYYTISIN